MSKEVAFLIAAGCTLAISAAAVVLLWRKLEAILLDLSRSEQRAPFWVRYWAVFLLLVPLVVLALGRPALSSQQSIFFHMIDLLGLGLAGLLAAFAGVGFGMEIFVRSRSRTVYVNPDLERLLDKVEQIRARNILRHVRERDQSSA